MSENTYYASIGRRILAFILDCLVLFVPLVVAGNIIPFLGGILVYFFYGPVLESSPVRATLGKYWVGIQVVDIQGRRISFQAALIRNLLKLLSPVLLFIGCLMAFFTKRQQTLHDLLADTIVVYGRDNYPLANAWAETVQGIFGKKIFKFSPDLSKLEKLHELREKGVLTEEEYQKEKKRILE
jgi:uncharacterized RDD family membrane protein YckC